MAVSKARRNRVKELWLGLPESWRTQLLSGFNTFVSTFLTEITTMLVTSSDFTLTRFMLIGAINVALRATLVKPTTTAVITRTLPDPKK